MYSRATTSLMAERFEPCFLVVLLGVVEGFSLGAIVRWVCEVEMLEVWSSSAGAWNRNNSGDQGDHEAVREP